MMVEAITFDVTGTLIRCPSLGQLYSDAFERHGVELSAAQVNRLFPLAWKELDCGVARGGDRFADHPDGARGFWRDLLTRLCGLAEVDAPSEFLVAELYQLFARGSSWSVFSEVVPVLDELKAAGFRLAVISNWDERLEPLLEDLELAHYFDVIVSSSAVGHAKPDPRIFKEAVGRLDLAPIEVLHVGDHRLNDFEGAAAAGLQAFLLDRGRGKDLHAAAQRARGSRL